MSNNKNEYSTLNSQVLKEGELQAYQLVNKKGKKELLTINQVLYTLLVDEMEIPFVRWDRVIAMSKTTLEESSFYLCTCSYSDILKVKQIIKNGEVLWKFDLEEYEEEKTNDLYFSELLTDLTVPKTIKFEENHFRGFFEGVEKFIKTEYKNLNAQIMPMEYQETFLNENQQEVLENLAQKGIVIEQIYDKEINDVSVMVCKLASDVDLNLAYNTMKEVFVEFKVMEFEEIVEWSKLKIENISKVENLAKELNENKELGKFYIKLVINDEELKEKINKSKLIKWHNKEHLAVDGLYAKNKYSIRNLVYKYNEKHYEYFPKGAFEKEDLFEYTQSFLKELIEVANSKEEKSLNNIIINNVINDGISMFLIDFFDTDYFTDLKEEDTTIEDKELYEIITENEKDHIKENKVEFFLVKVE